MLPLRMSQPPNADTLYSIAWLDLSKEVYVLHVPNESGRYYLMPMMDGPTCLPAHAKYHRNQSRRLRHHRSTLEGCATAQCRAVQIPHGHGMDNRSHLLNGQSRGLRGSTRNSRLL